MDGLYHFLRDLHVRAILYVAAEKGLFTLNLSHFEIATVPSQLYQLKNLESLHLENNHIKEISPEIKNLKNLLFLGLDYNNLETLPKEIKRLGSTLTGLNLSHNPLSTLLPEIGHLRTLSSLWLNQIGVSELPKEIGKLKLLDTFGARGNAIEILPKEFCKLHSLRWLTLEGNLIEELPTDFQNLISLIHLNLNKNCFKEVPEVIQHMTELQYCFLAQNKIKEISTIFLLQVKHLVKLDLRGNEELKITPDMKLFENLCIDGGVSFFHLPDVALTESRDSDSQMSHVDEEDEWGIEYHSEEQGEDDDNISDGDDMSDFGEEDWEESVPSSELDLSELSGGEAAWRVLDDEDSINLFPEDLGEMITTISSYVANGS